MGRIETQWFEFGGVRSADKGVRLIDSALYIRPPMRGDSLVASGRSGDLFQTDGAYDTVEIKRKCRVRLSALEDTSVWLTGSGLLRFSYAENRAYEARAVKAANFTQTIPGDDPLFEFDVTFTCQPFRLLYPEPSPISITQSGTTINNPGTAPSLPRVKIVGSGDFSLTIGMETLFFTGVEDGIIVDSALMDALTLDGALLANDHMSGTPFEIQPGTNVVSWLADNGTVQSVEITPRWRYI